MGAIELKKGEQMPEVLTDCVSNSVTSIFNTILGSKPRYGGDDDSDRKIGDGVVGIISFVGDVTWLMMLALPRESAKNIATKFCGFSVDYESPDMGDVVGELANVLAGDIVARLKEENVNVALSLPTVMRGHDIEPLLPRGIPAKKMYFDLPEGELMIKLAGANQGDPMGRRPGT